MTRTDRLGACALALVAGLALACAGATGGVTKDYGLAELAKPSVFIIYPFEFRASDVHIDEALLEAGRPVSTGERRSVGRKVAALVASQLATKLDEEGIPARQDDGGDQPLGAVLIKGTFTSIDQGDQAARVTVGMGAGVEKIEAMLQVYQVTPSGVRQFTEEFHGSEGDKMPGMAVTVGVSGVAGGDVLGSAAMGLGEKALAESLGGLEAAADDLTDHLVATTVAYYERRGWR